MLQDSGDGDGDGGRVKENVLRREPLRARWLAAALAGALAALAVAVHVDRALPEPRRRIGAPPDAFIAEIAHEHLVNLTRIGPRVAGSYENEVLAVAVVVAAVRDIARAAGPHVVVELDVQRASGAFPLAFMDGMSHVYANVQNVVVRVRAAGAEPPAARRSALLLNCHIDTVPDSPGASDDGAGCAVMLETIRALAAARSPPRHDAVFLFNGAEENVLQASHGFITQHKWAKSVRAFINLEACGAGGREVLFQAGPHDPWIIEMYSEAVPHPFASSLAQEVFESGLVPADTDFRIFRDFGNLSGVDLAWSSNGYVYHTALDTAERVPPAALQRTGDNVLALVHGLLASPRMESAVERSARQPVFFDVLGAVAVSVRPPFALLGAAAALALVALDVHLAAGRARRSLFASRAAWARRVAGGAAVCAASAAAGLAAAALVALALHCGGARLAWYARPALLGPLYAAPALLAAGAAARRLCARWRWARAAPGWWAARALASGGAAAAGALLAACAALRLRSGFLPALWAALPALAGAAARGGAPGGWWAGGALLPMLQTCYLAVPTLRMFVPIAGRASSPPVPIDVAFAVLTAALAMSACSWILPLAVATRNPRPLAWGLALTCALACALAAGGGRGAAYAPDAPQRVMVFHTRRTTHSAGARRSELLYWVPQMDENAPRPAEYGAAGAGAALPAARCAAWLYCGAPYHLPVRGLVPRSREAPAPPAPPAAPVPARLALALRTERHNRTHHTLHLDMTGEAHKVVIVSPAVGGRLAGCSALAHPQEGAPWGERRVYFFALHDALGPPAPARLSLLLAGPRGSRGAQLSVAGHALGGPRAPEHEAALRALPPWTAPTGWAVDLHLYRL